MVKKFVEKTDKVRSQFFRNSIDLVEKLQGKEPVEENTDFLSVASQYFGKDTKNYERVKFLYDHMSAIEEKAELLEKFPAVERFMYNALERALSHYERLNVPSWNKEVRDFVYQAEAVSRAYQENKVEDPALEDKANKLLNVLPGFPNFSDYFKPEFVYEESK